MVKGGYPEVITTSIDQDNYLKTLYESILFKDITKRFKIRYGKSLSDLGYYLISNHAHEITYSRLAKLLNFKSVHTVENYVDYLKQAYLLFAINRFSYSLKSQIKSPRKIYAFDTGLINAIKFHLTPDRGKLLENIVATELMRRGVDFYSYKTENQKEVDFAIKQGNQITQLMQVCQDLTDDKTKKRELTALTKASQELQCPNLSVLTWSDEKVEELQKQTIHFVPIWKWLLSQNFNE